MTSLTDKQKLEVFELFSFSSNEDLFWRLDEETSSELQIFVNCSDVFYWGCTDLEEVTQENFDILIESHELAASALEQPNHQLVEGHGLLFCAKIRGLRPQGAYYHYIKEELWSLFDECGPERELDLNNPKPQPNS